MNLNEITASINNWKAISHDSNALLDVLGQGDCFYYKFDNYGSQIQQSIHAYPGIHNNEFKFFMIPAEYDTEQYAEELDKYITVCPVFQNPPTSNRLPESEAKARIDLWKNEYKTWVPKQAASNDGIFLAFKIDAIDFEVSETLLNLALKLDNNPTKFKADIIVTNKTATEVVYDDYAQPVPPYGATASASSFYLLQI